MDMHCSYQRVVCIFVDEYRIESKICFTVQLPVNDVVIATRKTTSSPSLHCRRFQR